MEGDSSDAQQGRGPPYNVAPSPTTHDPSSNRPRFADPWPLRGVNENVEALIELAFRPPQGEAPLKLLNTDNQAASELAGYLMRPPPARPNEPTAAVMLPHGTLADPSQICEWTRFFGDNNSLEWDDEKQECGQTGSVFYTGEPFAYWQDERDRFVRGGLGDFGLRSFAGSVPVQDASLGLVSRYLHLISLFKEYMWIYFPLHPAIFDEENVRYLLTSPDGKGEVSALSVGTCLAVSLGSLLVGDWNHSMEWYDKAVGHLADIVKYTDALYDYSMALAASALGFFTLWWKLDPVASKEYFQLVITICKRLNALNSDAYSRCMYALAFHPETSYQDIRNLRVELQEARKLPFFSVTSVRSPFRSPSTSRGYIEEEVTIEPPVSHKNLIVCAESCRVASNVLMGLRVCRDRRELVPLAQEEQQRILVDLAAAVHAWRTEMEVSWAAGAQVNDPMPPPAVWYSYLLFCVTECECARLSGNYPQAIELGLALIQKVYEYAPDFLYLAAGVPHFVELVFNLFWEVQRYDYLQTLLEAVENWGKLCPFMGNIISNYKAKLQQVGYVHVINSSSSSSTSSNAGNSDGSASANSERLSPTPFPYMQEQQPYQKDERVHNQWQSREFHSIGEFIQNARPYDDFGMESYTAVKAQHSTLQPVVDSRDSKDAEEARSDEEEDDRAWRFPEAQLDAAESEGSSDSLALRGKRKRKGGKHQPQKRRQTKASATTATRASSSSSVVATEISATLPSSLIQDMRLGFMQTAFKFVDLYKYTFWAFSPLIPSAMNEVVVTRVLSDSSMEFDSMYLSVYLMLSRGAMLMGATERSSELFNRSEQILENLLQSPESLRDYSIALALHSMGWHAHYFQLPDSKSERYFRLAIQICEAIGAFNSDVYYRCVFALYGADPTYTNSLLVKSLDKVKDYPYFPLTATIAPPLSEGDINPQEVRYSVSEDWSEIERKLPVTIKVLNDIASAVGIMSNITAGLQVSRVNGKMQEAEEMLKSLQLYEDLVAEIRREGEEKELAKGRGRKRAWAKEKAAEGEHELGEKGKEKEKAKEKEKEKEKEPSKEEETEEEDTEQAREERRRKDQEAVLARAKEEGEKENGGPKEVWPPSVNKYNRLFLLASKADCYNMLGRREEAVFYARKFVEMSERRKVGRLVAAISFPFSIVVRVVDSLGEYQLLARLLVSMNKWEAWLPVMAQMKRVYSVKLQQHLMMIHTTPPTQQM